MLLDQLQLLQAVAGLDVKGTTPLQRLLSLQQLAQLTGNLYFLPVIHVKAMLTLTHRPREVS